MAQHPACLVLNAGSSSLKFSVFRDDPTRERLQPVLSGQVSGIGGTARLEAKDAERRVIAERYWSADQSLSRQDLLYHVLAWISTTLDGDHIVAVGHRVVHGGPDIAEPRVVGPALLEALQQLVPLAPLHQPHNIAPMRLIAERFPDLPQVACFDTAFHRGQPWVTRTYALPKELTADGVCSYGFHGLSYEYVSRTLLAARPELARSRVVVCHLGNGSSVCAVQNGRSVDTSMGFTALDGVPMGTRCGAIDPSVIFYLVREYGMTIEDVETLLYTRSGLLGVSGLSNDMKVLLESTDADAHQAVELFCFRVAKEVAAQSASIGGLDALVFTGGIGENAPRVRELIAERLAWLGVELDASANTARHDEIGVAGARVRSFVVPTNEELMIAQHTLALLREARSPLPAARPTTPARRPVAALLRQAARRPRTFLALKGTAPR
ncbi:acetate/propionate family kinase [Rubrivivax gelatinosus]|uniref:Acetate kinase n=1 Tax=Rubrivivax gelatinosus TaxID=28068 RepID=A0A4R2LSW1_RUBGE|nr:acetate/propionate family kinase [Rubrivivax gelatinosus]MBK1689860.1 acetate kinase [Rubrivivax gelatinosus]TCO97131.1 acetate kinase [Rubrivivax gelatinosus]